MRYRKSENISAIFSWVYKNNFELYNNYNTLSRAENLAVANEQFIERTECKFQYFGYHFDKFGECTCGYTHRFPLWSEPSQCPHMPSVPHCDGQIT